MSDFILETAEKINEVNGVLGTEFRSSLSNALKMGEMFIHIKDQCGRGNWTPLFEEGRVSCSQSTARKYMLLARHKFDVDMLPDIQSAAKRARAIEKAERDEKKKALQPLIDLRFEKGENPQGWTKAHEREYQRQLKKAQKDDGVQEPNAEEYREEVDEDYVPGTIFEQKVQEGLALIHHIEQLKQKMSGQEDILFIIDGFLEKIEDVPRRHEFSNTIIKHLRKTSVECDRMAS